MSDYEVTFASSEQIAAWDTERIAEQGQPWGVGKAEAEIEAEAERRVQEWEFGRDTRKALIKTARDAFGVESDPDARFKARVEAAEPKVVRTPAEMAADLEDLLVAFGTSTAEEESNAAADAAFWGVVEAAVSETEAGGTKKEEPADERAAILAMFPTLDAKAILDPHRPPRRWIWDGVAGYADQTSIVAAAGTGKSLLVLGLTVALQRGRPDFIGRPITKPRRTLYLDLENSDDDWHDRLTDMGVTEAELQGWLDTGSLYIIPFPRLGGLDTEAGGTMLFKLIDALELTDGDLVIFDSTQRITTGEENSNDTGRKLYEHTIFGLKRRNIASIRTDNTGKDTTKGARGGSSKIDDVANSWALSVDDPKAPEVYELTNLKKRSSGGSDTLSWEYDDTSGRLEFVPKTTMTFSAVMASVGAALDAAKVPHSTGQVKAWDDLKDWFDGSTPAKTLPPEVTRALVRKEQAERRYISEAFRK